MVERLARRRETSTVPTVLFFVCGNYYAVCVAYNNIECKSIKGRRKNSKHFVLDGKLEVKEDE